MFLNKGPVFAFCTRTHKLCSWFCSLNLISQLFLTYRDEGSDEGTLLDAIRDTKKSVPQSSLFFFFVAKELGFHTPSSDI